MPVPPIGFFFRPSIGVPLNERRDLKAAVKNRIAYLDPNMTRRIYWATLTPLPGDPNDGHIDEYKVKDVLDAQVATIIDQQGNGGYIVGAQVEWCYAVRNQTVVCYHCYSLLEQVGVDANGKAIYAAVTVTLGPHTVALELYYAWETQF